MGIQDFGDNFNLSKFYHARDIAIEMTHELASYIMSGMTEEEAHEHYKRICQEHKIEKNWHPPKIRFGPNTRKSFKEPSDPYTLQDEDIFYIDIGPVIDGHEADYGETFVMGSNFEHKLLADASQKLFKQVSDRWKKNSLKGTELYLWASQRALELGYKLNMGSDGHRIGDFPHHLFFKGAIIECEEKLIPNAWILEIQLDHPQLPLSSFFEDVLN